ncbi:HotDog domain-containing protein [Schizophyllum amplum]|uniref:HotDog domain-containing protein n=1 Tax=Schizophyllum amplum TaxID=97359 RepID=A0A550CC86_9AGAR|nr:HotDog domain-containing protein [Auriculariopsis ampla]
MSTPLLRRLRLPASRPSARFSTSSPPPQTRRISFLAASVAAASVGLAGYAAGAVFPPPATTVLFPRVAPPPLPESTPEGQKHMQDLEDAMQRLPLLQQLRAAQDADEWYEARPYLFFPEERRVNNLTAGVLRGPGKLAVHALVRARKDETESYVILHVGRALCGHDGIVHGGLLATLLDESLARTAIMNLPERVGVTATLTVHYKAPVKADQFIIIKTRAGEVNGRKAAVSGIVQDLEGKELANASALFVQPRYAKLLDPDMLRKRMGEPTKKSGEPVTID